VNQGFTAINLAEGSHSVAVDLAGGTTMEIVGQPAGSSEIGKQRLKFGWRLLKLSKLFDA
jgi:hypothetical protein